MSQFNIPDSSTPTYGSTPMFTSVEELSPSSSPPPTQYDNNTTVPATTSNAQIFSTGNTSTNNQQLIQVAVLVNIPPNAENAVGQGQGDDAGNENGSANYKMEAELRRNPCYTFGVSMDKGARIWASVNLAAATVDLIFTFVHLLYIHRVIGVTNEYLNYFLLFHSMECPSTLKIDITLSYVGSICNLIAACLFFYATYFVKDTKFCYRLCLLFNHIIFVPLIFCMPRFVIGLYGGKQEGSAGCILQPSGSAVTNFWVLNICVLIGYIIWFLYGFWISVAFVRLLNISSSEDNTEKGEKDSASVDRVEMEDENNDDIST